MPGSRPAGCCSSPWHREMTQRAAVGGVEERRGFRPDRFGVTALPSHPRRVPRTGPRGQLPLSPGAGVNSFPDRRSPLPALPRPSAAAASPDHGGRVIPLQFPPLAATGWVFLPWHWAPAESPPCQPHTSLAFSAGCFFHLPNPSGEALSTCAAQTHKTPRVAPGCW